MHTFYLIVFYLSLYLLFLLLITYLYYVFYMYRNHVDSSQINDNGGSMLEMLKVIVIFTTYFLLFCLLFDSLNFITN